MKHLHRPKLYKLDLLWRRLEVNIKLCHLAT